jgi:predicted phosphohydrolase
MLETESCSANDKKIIAREASRLERSLASAGDGEKIAVMHYPPVYNGIVADAFINVLKKYRVNRCFYGHLHSGSIKNADTGAIFDINFTLVSADAIDFLPISI